VPTWRFVLAHGAFLFLVLIPTPSTQIINTGIGENIFLFFWVRRRRFGGRGFRKRRCLVLARPFFIEFLQASRYLVAL